MSQHDFNIANQSFPATRTDLNNALVALASNSSGDAEPATKYANQFWYETDTNTLKLRNEANDAWISIAVLDQSGNAVQSITTAGLTLGSTSISATGAEINQLDAITRGSILYGNASGATARLAAGGAGTVLSSDGTDISWAAGGGGGTPAVVFPSNWASPTNTYTTSGTWSKGSLSDNAYVWFFLLGGGGGGSVNTAGFGGSVRLIYAKAGLLNGAAFVVGAGSDGVDSGSAAAGGQTILTLSSGNGSSVFATPTDDTNNILNVVTAPTPNVSGTYLNGGPDEAYGFSTKPLPSGYEKVFTGSYAEDVIFGGARGNHTGQAASTSLLSGNGGVNTGGDGAAPGGGGAAGHGSGQIGGDGAQGNVRVYHV